MAGAHEDQAKRWKVADRPGRAAHQRFGVEPIPDPTGPDGDRIVRADGFRISQPHATWHRRFVGNPERHYRQQVAQSCIGPVRHRVDPAERAEHADPVVPLALGRAQEEVTGLHRNFQTCEVLAVPRQALRWGLRGVQLQPLDQRWVIDVDHLEGL